jgi:hypothetical protein
MKKTSLYLSILLMSSVLFTSCIKQTDKNFTGKTVVEIDATVLNSNAAGLTYPILTRKPLEGIPIATADSTARRISGTIRLRINLVGPQSAKDEIVGYKTFTSPITSISFPATATGQTPTRASGTLNVLDAVAGTHYTAFSGKATIPAGKSFGYVDVNILDAGATAGQGRFVGIQLDSTGTVMPNPNYNKIGLVIDQR